MARGTGRKSATAVLLCLLASAALPACGGGARPIAAPAVGGRVVTADGAPLVDARVVVHRETAWVVETQTGPDGRFRVDVEGDGPVRIQASKPVEIRTETGGRDWAVHAVDVDGVLPGWTDLDLVARVETQDRVVSVRVVTPEGPLPDALVHTWPRVLPPEAYRWIDGQPDATDREGLTVQEHLTASPIGLRVERLAPWCPACVPFVLPGDAATAPIREVRLVRERLLHGRVVDEEGRPVAGVGVTPTSAEPGSARGWGDLTGLDGSFCAGVPETWTRATFLVGLEDPHATTGAAGSVDVELGWREIVGPIELVVPTPPRARTETDERLGPDAVHVIETVLRHGYVGEKTRAVLLVSHTWTDEYATDDENLRRLADVVQPSTIEDLKRKNARPVPLPATLALDVPVLLLDQRWIDHWHETYQHEAWERFRARFRGCTGRIYLTAVGFSQDGDEALLHVGESRGRLNGDGHYYVLARERGVWRVVQCRGTWIS